jgi:hypothetical protein
MSDAAVPDLVRRNLRFGWWALFVYAAVGLGLEALHGLKLGLYLDVGNETRRLLWTLAHAHGVLLALLNIVFALCVRAIPGSEAHLKLGSTLLMAASILLPLGFLLGGIWVYGGDPGLGVLLVPPGALCLLAGLFATARGLTRS